MAMPRTLQHCTGQPGGERFVAGLCVILPATLMLLSAGVRAERVWMTDAELSASFAGTTIDGQYVDGRSFRERYETNGALDYAETAAKRRMTGYWSIVRGRFCTIYDGVASGGCFRVRQVSGNCFEFFFETRTEEEARQSTLRKPTWTARAWRIDYASTCEERPLV